MTIFVSASFADSFANNPLNKRANFKGDSFVNNNPYLPLRGEWSNLGEIEGKTTGATGILSNTKRAYFA